MSLAFGILSSVESPDAVAQLVDALGPDHRVWVHHDASKGPVPAPLRDGVHFVQDTVATRWGEWSLCDAIVRMLRSALEQPGWSYFQLLSGSCLPIRPIAEFERHVRHDAVDAHVDMVALDADETALMSHGFRAFAPQGTLGHRVLRRLRRWYMGPDQGSVDRNGLGFSTPGPGRTEPAARLALGSMKLAAAGTAPGLAHPFGPGFRCFVGSTWWGARREVCEYIASQPDDGELQRFFKRLLIPDEFYFQTLIANSGFRVGASNHAISRFDDAHPIRFGEHDLPALRSSGRFFARKFPDVADDPVRLQVLSGIGALPGRHGPQGRAVHAHP